MFWALMNSLGAKDTAMKLLRGGLLKIESLTRLFFQLSFVSAPGQFHSPVNSTDGELDIKTL